ncbi:MAG: RNA polymerase factor sigma-54 [bacterium]|nr:RNA polymerase factor sigma-54 [bacterium]
MAIKLNLKIGTQITINPIIHTFIGFLPLSRLEFIDKIKNEVEANPMLEIDSPGASQAASDKDVGDIEKRMERADSSLVNSYKEEEGFLRNREKMDKNRAIELFSASSVSLSDYLMEQAMSQFDENELDVAAHIIYNLNNDGYLNMEIESIASSIGTTPEEIERIRRLIKGFDPPGVAARSLQECLLAQLEDNEENEKLRELIAHHLEDLSKSRYEDTMKHLQVSREELTRLISRLKRLEPRPGSMFEEQDVDYAEVDLLLVKEENEYKIRYIEDGIPMMLLSSYYEQMLDKSADKKTKSYLKERYRNAQLFIDGMDLRKSMIVKIAEILVKRQKDFLDFGEKWKKPLTMKEVAQELGYNESTISRAVSGKFIASETGLISLKKFFSYGIKGEFGFVHSVETIRDKIKKIIEEEPKTKPLSDQNIAAKLANLGIKISRRTIRNYRDEMNLPSSSKRKEKYKMEAAEK